VYLLQWREDRGASVGEPAERSATCRCPASPVLAAMDHRGHGQGGEWQGRLEQGRREQEQVWEGQGEGWEEQGEGWEEQEQGEARPPVNIVFFHLDTTGQQEPVRPLHIGAVDSWGEAEFETYVWPEQPIEQGSHLYTEGDQLFREWHDQPLPCLGLEDALTAFMNWLGEVEGSVVLVAHGCFREQGKVLLRNLEEFQIPYDHLLAGFTDSRVASEKLVPRAQGEHGLTDMLLHLKLDSSTVDDAVEKAEDCRRVSRVLANLCRMKFLDFVLDPDWSIATNHQWELAFE